MTAYGPSATSVGILNGFTPINGGSPTATGPSMLAVSRIVTMERQTTNNTARSCATVLRYTMDRTPTIYPCCDR